MWKTNNIFDFFFNLIYFCKHANFKTNKKSANVFVLLSCKNQCKCCCSRIVSLHTYSLQIKHTHTHTQTNKKSYRVPANFEILPSNDWQQYAAKQRVYVSDRSSRCKSVYRAAHEECKTRGGVVVLGVGTRSQYKIGWKIDSCCQTASGRGCGACETIRDEK